MFRKSVLAGGLAACLASPVAGQDIGEIVLNNSRNFSLEEVLVPGENGFESELLDCVYESAGSRDEIYMAMVCSRRGNDGRLLNLARMLRLENDYYDVSAVQDLGVDGEPDSCYTGTFNLHSKRLTPRSFEVEEEDMNRCEEMYEITSSQF